MRINKLNYVAEAEKVMNGLGVKKPNADKMQFNLTTSKIRNILAMVSEIYNDTVHEEESMLSEEMRGRVQYLKMRVAYEAGRDRTVEDFVKKAYILEIINEIGTSKENLILFCHYMEALVAYHRFLGGND